MSRKLLNEELNRLSTEDFKKSEKFPITIILDNVRSHLNVGSVFRTCDSFLLDEILLCGITGCPPHRDIYKTALGATETMNWKYFETTSQAVEYCKSQKMKIYAIEQAENSIMLDKFSPESNQAMALIFGNEVEGVQQDIVNQCDGTIEIPQYGMKHSLNISVSVGIVVWEVVRKILKMHEK